MARCALSSRRCAGLRDGDTEVGGGEGKEMFGFSDDVMELAEDANLLLECEQ